LIERRRTWHVVVVAVESTASWNEGAFSGAPFFLTGILD